MMVPPDKEQLCGKRFNKCGSAKYVYHNELAEKVSPLSTLILTATVSGSRAVGVKHETMSESYINPCTFIAPKRHTTSRNSATLTNKQTL